MLVQDNIHKYQILILCIACFFVHVSILVKKAPNPCYIRVSRLAPLGAWCVKKNRRPVAT